MEVTWRQEASRLRRSVSLKPRYGGYLVGCSDVDRRVVVSVHTLKIVVVARYWPRCLVGGQLVQVGPPILGVA